MSKSTSGENFFIDPDIKKKVIEHLIKGILVAKTGEIVATETKEDLRLWQNNLGQYLGYLTNNPYVNRPDFLNFLFSICIQQIPESESNALEWVRRSVVVADYIAIPNLTLTKKHRDKLRNLNHFLSKNDIEEILRKTGCSEDDLKNEEFFRLFLGSLSKDEKKFIYDSVVGGLFDNNNELLKTTLNQEHIVKLSDYGLPETSPSPAIQKPNSSASAPLQDKNMSRPSWYKQTREEAYKVLCEEFSYRAPKIAAASPIYPTISEKNSYYKNNGEAVDTKTVELFKKKFPYSQLSRGDGACYFNSAFAAILHDCVGDEEKWREFRQSLENIFSHASFVGGKNINDFIAQIGEGKEFPTREKVNEILTKRGDDNIVTQLAKKFLVDIHGQSLIDSSKEIIIQEAALHLLEWFDANEAVPNNQIRNWNDLINEYKSLEARDARTLKDGDRKRLTEALDVRKAELIKEIVNKPELLVSFWTNVVDHNKDNFTYLLQNLESYEAAKRGGELAGIYDASQIEELFGPLYTKSQIFSITNEGMKNAIDDGHPKSNTIYFYNANSNSHFDVLHADLDKRIARDLSKTAPTYDTRRKYNPVPEEARIAAPTPIAPPASSATNTQTQNKHQNKIEVLLSVLNASVNETIKAEKCTLSSKKCLTEFGQKNLGEFLGYIRDLAIKDDSGNEAFSQKKLEEFATNLELDNETLKSPQFFHTFLLEFHKQRALAESKTNQNFKTFKEGNVLGDHKVFKVDVTGETNKGDIYFYYSEAIGNNRHSQEDSFIIGEEKDNWSSAEAPHLMEKTFNELGEKIQKYCSYKKLEDGSTALLTHYSTDQKLTIANLGDSRAVLFIKKSDGSIDWIRLTNDQEPDDILEKARIVKNGGHVNKPKKEGTPARVIRNDGDFLSVARSFGDTKFEGVSESTGDGGHTYSGTNYKKLISFKPDIYQYDIGEILAKQGEGAQVFLLNSCDGLYDHGKGNEATYAKALENWSNNKDDVQKKCSHNIAKYLRDYALALGSHDNVTVCFSNITNAPLKSVFNGVFDGHSGKIVSSIAAEVLKEQLLKPDSIIHSPMEKQELEAIDLNDCDIQNATYPHKQEYSLYPKAEPVMVAKIEPKKTQNSAQSGNQSAIGDAPALMDEKQKKIKAQNKPTYAYTDRDIDAVNRARNKSEGIGYFKNSKGQESGILLKGEKPLTEKGTTIELPACDLFQGSSIGSHLKAQLENFKEFSKDKKPSDLYPVKILFPYKTDGWNWKVGEITVSKSSENFSLKGCDYDPVNKEVSLDSEIWEEISKTFEGSFSDKKFTTLNNLMITSINTLQKGEIASGLYAARAMYNLKTNITTRNVWNDTLGEESDLRSKDSELVISHNSESNFCAPLNAGGLVDIFQTEKSEKSPNNQLGSETDSTKTADQQTLEQLNNDKLRDGSQCLGDFLCQKANNKAPSSRDLFDALDSNPLREIIFTNDDKDAIKPDDHLLNLVREANLIYTTKKFTDITGTLTSTETEKKRKYQDCIDIISGSYANSLRQLVISSCYQYGEEKEEKIKALEKETISIIEKKLPGEENDVLVKVLVEEMKITNTTIWIEVQLARKSSIEEMKKGLIAMMEKEEKQDSDEKNEATPKTVSLIEKFAESNNPILTKDAKNYTPLEAAKEKIGEELKEASKNSAAKLEKAKAVLNLETQGEKEEYKKGGKHEYDEQKILKYSAKGILSKALKVSIIEERAKKDEGKNTISKTIDEPKLYERYARKNFIGDAANKIKFEDKKFEGNSFANCTFKNCDFSATDNKTMHFVNCTFDEGCVLPQNLKNQENNFSGCKFSKEIFDAITDGSEKNNLKKSLGIDASKTFNNGFYEIAKPNPSPTSVAAFKLDSNLITHSVT